MNVLFLDVDGVLNSIYTVEQTPSGFRGIDDKHVEILASIVGKYDLKIVLSSDWKMSLSESHEESYRYLVSKLAKFGLEIYDKTPTHRDWWDRSGEIKEWLDDNQPDAVYVVVDDFEKIVKGIDDKHKVITYEGWGLTEFDAECLCKLIDAQLRKGGK